MLEALLVEYQGTVLLVSHDRAFLNDVVTSTLVIEGDGQVKEYEGGYDDYLSQRPAAVAAPTRSVAREIKAQSPAQTRTQPRKLSSRDRKELESLPERIEQLESQVGEIHDAMADAAFYRQERQRITQATARLEELEHELAAAYERWNALEELSD